MLEAIESEDFEALPARPYLRGFLVSYSSFLGLDGDNVTRDYLFIYDKWKERRK
jgi:cytoskeletal protein RodZ